MNAKYVRTTTVLVLALGLGLAGCSKKAVEDAASTVDDSTGGGGGTTNEVAAFAGTWATPCVSQGTTINSVANWRKAQISVGADGSGSMIVSFHSNSSCNSTMIWMLTPVTFTYSADTTSPANGKKFMVSAAGSQQIQSQSASSSTHLNSSGCTYSSFAMGVSGVSTNSGFTCSGDSRFNMHAVSGSQNMEVVFVLDSATQISSTAFSLNMPGVSGSAATSVTNTLTKQ